MTEKSSIHAVPFHSIGISQIISYGLLFYAFAQTKVPLATHFNVEENTILSGLTASLILQGVLMPVVGSWVDRHGALTVMARGFVIGALGLLLMTVTSSLFMFWGCMILIGIALAMCTYEVAFGAAVQMDESRSRRNISFITFYGGVASSMTWLLLAPLLKHIGLAGAMICTSGVMLMMAIRYQMLARQKPFKPVLKDNKVTPFSWQVLSRAQKQALVTLATTSTLEYVIFAGTTLLWITWFSQSFGAGLAVILASIYGPFQVVGRVLEMTFGHRFDARRTALVAFALVPLSLVLAQSPSLPIVIFAMMLFGIGHGILTVSFGYVTNMYFNAEIYGRAKGWISGLRGVGTAFGPSIGGALFMASTDLFFTVTIVIAMIGGMIFASLLAIRPENDRTG